MVENKKEKSKHEIIRKKALELLKEHQNGMRYSQLVKALQESNQEIKVNTIRGAIWNLDKIYPELVSKPDKGIFKLKEDAIKKQIIEEDFYQKFAEYLKELHECTKSITYGSSRQGKKWENPDVIGMYQVPISANIYPLFISGELKISSRWEDIIQGFGQASSYLLFSHKSYLAIPKSIEDEDQRKIESLCVKFGIGLVFFDSSDPENPKFELRNRATTHEPDLYIFSQRIKEFWDALNK